MNRDAVARELVLVARELQGADVNLKIVSSIQRKLKEAVDGAKDVRDPENVRVISGEFKNVSLAIQKLIEVVDEALEDEKGGPYFGDQ